jgi:hypothetical protein
MNKLPMKNPALAQNKEAMKDRLTAMRLQAGIPDRRVLHFTCSVTGKGFSISFKRQSANHRFQIEATEGAAGNAGGLLGKLFGTPEEPAQSFAINEFDCAGFVCPHCGHRQTIDAADFFQCGCNRLLCGGRITVMNGVTRYACHDSCGNSGVLGAAIKSVAGETGNSLGGPGGAKRLSGPAKYLPRK